MPAAETNFAGPDVAAVASLLESVLVLEVEVAVGVSCLCCPAVDSGMVGLGAARAEAVVHLDYTPQALHHIH